MRFSLLTIPAVVCLALAACTEAPQTGTYSAGTTGSDSAEGTDTMADSTDAKSAPILDGLTMDRLDGTPETLSTAYAGMTLLIVNTASRCGLTGQYAGLEALHQSKGGDGFVVLGFPANDFMGQEPGSNEEIAEFCQQNYGVSFPMFAKTSVKGDDANALFARLTDATEEPSWNFTKYLVTSDGTITRFDPRTAPDDAGLVQAIDEALASS